MANHAGYMLPETVAPENTKCVVLHIPDDPNHLRAFWGHLFQLARWWSWERDEAHTGTEAAQVWAQVWANARSFYEENGGECPSSPDAPDLTDDQIQDLIDQYILTGGVFAPPDDCEDEMSCTIVHINGVAYIAEPCGCNETKFYRLDAASVSVGADGDAKITDYNPKDEPTDVYAYDASAVIDCYASKAVSEALARAANYETIVMEILNVGWSAAELIGGELYDIAEMVKDFADGDTPSYWGMNPAMVTPILTGSEVYNSLVDKWTTAQQVSRAELIAWAQLAPEDVATVPVRVLLTDWAKYCNLASFNSALSAHYADCVASSGAVPDAPGDAYYAIDYEHGGLTYPIWVAYPNAQLAEGMSWQPPAEYFAATADAFHMYRVDAMNYGSTLEAYARGGGLYIEKTVNVNDGLPVVYSRNPTAVHKAIAESMWGALYYCPEGGSGNTSDPVFQIQNGTTDDAIVTLGAWLAIGAPS